MQQTWRFFPPPEEAAIASLDAENITRQVKGSNLTTAISEKLKRPDRTLCYLVYIIRRFSFSENLGTAMFQPFQN